jgi:branched-chain amino acid transport system ATP-binding protein
MGSLLELQTVHASYGSIKALHGVSFSVEEGSIVAILGANGAGKTTTLRAISGTVKRSGEVRFADRSIARLAPEDVARLGIAHVPEGRGTLSELTVEENLEMGAYTQRGRGRIRAEMDRVYGYFPWMQERRTQPAGLLSGGEQQMLAIGRALMMHPRLLLLDEPSLGLAPIVVLEIFKIIQAINRDDNVTILLVEQNARIALQVSQQAHVLEVGTIVVSGSGSELAEDEAVRRSYLGY